MVYVAKIKMEDTNSNDVFRDEGKAEKVLAKSLNYLKHKEGIGVLKRIAKYVSEDFSDLANALTRWKFRWEK